MITKPFNEITRTDIETLVTDTVTENRNLEYKRTLPGTGHKEKLEFLADVSSFANAVGGDLLYGIREGQDEQGQLTGEPVAAEGLNNLNLNAEVLRLERLLQEGLAPRLPVIQMREIPGFPKGPVLHIRISKSWSAPHMITYRNYSRFYSRTNRGRYQLDVHEIRTSFAMSEEQRDYAEQFRSERLAKIVAGETPVPLRQNPLLVLHIIPLSSLHPDCQIEITREVKKHQNLIHPIYAKWSRQRYNFDGYLTYVDYQDNVNHSYLQIFRNGIIEAVDAAIIRHREEGTLFLPITSVEQKIIAATVNYFQLLEALGIKPPFFIMFSLLRVKDYVISLRGSTYNLLLIDRDALVIPAAQVQDYPESPGVLLRSVFDTIWQAAGYEGSPNYNEQGNWQQATMI